VKSTNRKCAQCRKKVDSSEALYGGLKAFCCYECLRKYIDSERGQKAVQSVKRKDIKERKEKLKTRSDYLKEAQVAFNKYVRIRDEGKPCISCGSVQVDSKVGGVRDCGHYLSRGAHPEARFRFGLDNTASQCVRCNRYLSGNVANFRHGLIDRWGIDRVEAMETCTASSRMTTEYLKRIKSIFTRRANLYERIRNKRGCN
jgi:hypothetical protein